MNTITYQSVIWDTKKQTIRKARLSINLYEAATPTGIIVWIPGMSDKPIADPDNPLLSYFIPRALKKGLSVAVICFPGTFDRRYVEERTLGSMRQNVTDAIAVLSKRVRSYPNLKKILIGRSAGGTLVPSFLNSGFDLGISIAGRLKLNDLYRRIKRDFGKRAFYPINTVKPFLRIRSPITINEKTMYCLNKQYVIELGQEESNIMRAFAQANATMPLLAIQAKDDDVVPFQLDRWEQLSQKNNLPITLFPLAVPCGHTFATQPAIRLTTQKILSFITTKGARV